MPEFAKSSADIWQEGSGGLHEPKKSEIRTWTGVVERVLSQLNVSISAGFPHYETPASGVAATSQDDYFITPGVAADSFLDLYQHTSGSTATLIDSLPSDVDLNPLTARVDALEAVEVLYLTEAELLVDLSPAASTLALALDTGSGFQKVGAEGTGSWNPVGGSGGGGSAFTLNDIEAAFWAEGEKRRAAIGARDAGRPIAFAGLMGGQSLAFQRASSTAIFTAAGHLMFNGGPNTNQFTHASSNETHTATIDDMASLVDYTDTDGLEGLTRAVGTAAAGRFARTSACSAAVGARTLAILFNNGPRNNLFAAAERMGELLASHVDGPYTPRMPWQIAHGEADANAGTSRADYADQLRSAFIDIRLASAWGADNPDYVVPIMFHQMMMGDTTEAFHEIIQAQADVVRETPRCVFVTAAYPYMHEADEVHPYGEGYAVKSEIATLYGSQMMMGDEDVGCPTCEYVVRNGSIIEAVFKTPRGVSLTEVPEIDFARAIDGSTELLGFQYHRSGALIDLTGASLSIYGRVIHIKLASDPGAVLADEELRYAMQEDAAALQSGGQNRAGGNIRTVEVAVESAVLRMHLFQFTNGITGSGSPGDSPAGRVIIGATSGATALVHRVTYTSGSFDTDDAEGFFTAYRVTGQFAADELVEIGTAIDMTLVGAPVIEPFQHENWLTRFAVAVTEASE